MRRSGLSVSLDTGHCPIVMHGGCLCVCVSSTGDTGEYFLEGGTSCVLFGLWFYSKPWFLTVVTVPCTVPLNFRVS